VKRSDRCDGVLNVVRHPHGLFSCHSRPKESRCTSDEVLLPLADREIWAGGYQAVESRVLAETVQTRRKSHQSL
jgi:hypothetical protein